MTRARIAYLDCSTGVSGDKLLGALLDVGTATGEFTAADLQRVLDALAPGARAIVEPRTSRGVSAMGVAVASAENPSHRHWRDIRAMLETAALPDRVRTRALDAFTLLADAEAAAHGCAADDVHFHEVGALDSIMDVVGTCAGIEALGIEALTVSAVAVGSGTVDTSHGVLPVPAPATARLLVGVPVHAGPLAGELTTPTGAALVKALAAGFGPCPAMVPERVGYGAGTRDIGAPNVCQLIVGRAAVAPRMELEAAVLLETNIDHLTGEAVAVAIAQLMTQGALDVWATPITMKKGRPALMLSVLAAGEPEPWAQRIATATGSLGVRTTTVERYAVERSVHEIATEWGAVRVKIGAGRVRPESDDVARIAAQTSQPYRAVAQQLETVARELLGDAGLGGAEGE